MSEHPILFSGAMIRALLAGTKTQTRRVVKPQPAPFAGGVHPLHVKKHAAPYIDAYCGEEKTDVNPRGMGLEWFWWGEDDRIGAHVGKCPYGAPGDRLWVREAHAFMACSSGAPGFLPWKTHDIFPSDMAADADGFRVVFASDGCHPPESSPGDEFRGGWKPSIHMPRWASRITLEVTDVHVQRLHDISDEDVEAEGIETLDNFDWNTKTPLTGKRFSGMIEGQRYWMNATAAYQSLWDSINGPGAWDANPWVWAVSFRRVTP